MKDLLICVKNAEAEYLGGYSGIKDVSLCLDRGHRLVVYGREGSGKTTLLRVIAGLENLKRGNILLDGKDIANILPEEKDIGFSFDYRSLDIHHRVKDALSYPMTLRKYDEAVINQKVEELTAFGGLDSDAKIKQLNSLQKSLLILLRLFSVERKLYLVDDIADGLSDDEKREYYKAFADLSKGKSVIIATADKDFALDFGKDDLLILSDGLGYGQGSVDKIAELPPYMESASVCGYELHIGYLQKDGENYVGVLEEEPPLSDIVRKPLNDIYLGKKVCFCVKDGKIRPFYYDLGSERLISR